ncbi:DUF4435 domain-containing protein [Acinetobacter baumannii]|nr:DUF4435 domain-containing protein [Acinetobacter baumannii]EKV1717796.1 DUF4435 domain-containing protein [Acinetobacter baumannii]MDO7472068.1 DUF4435 domain-containing protein [Acinetobacter baumannii]MDO7506721.1 DUF4435 domain-containing protein [Acinetobacter baumannii]MDV7657689.1 DUF4435 domain-containing protein [Acinetobacter baumannii]
MSQEKSNSNRKASLRNMISWGNSANNIGYFYFSLQDINIYVEDTAKGSEAIYKALVSNLFPDKKIRSIICLGGRSDVIEACKAKKNSIKELYIIDGDLNLLYEPKIKMKGLFNNGVYCVENYMVDESALATILEETLVLEPEIAKEKLSWSDFVTSMKNAFLEPFILYAVSHLLKCPEKTIKRFDSKTWINHSVKKGEYKSPNQEVINKSISELKMRLINDYSKVVVDNNIELIRNKINKLSDEEIINFISGKNYLLPFVCNYLGHKGVSLNVIPIDSLKYRLIKASRHKELEKLQSAIREVAVNGEYIP